MLWDVVEEHLDEAEFLLEQWVNATRSARLTLIQLKTTVERRLVAHLDGLAVGGREVADKLLWRTLDPQAEAPPFRVTAAALALLLDPESAVRDKMIDLFRTTESDPVRAGLRQALTLSERTDLDEPVRLALYATQAPAAQAAILKVLAARRVNPGPILGHLLRHAEPDVLGAALDAGAAADPGPYQNLVEDLLAAKVPAIRAAALGTALLWNLASGWRTCLAEARAGAPAAMLLVATLGGPGELTLLTTALRSVEQPAEQRQAALFALGFSGRCEAVEACLPFLADPDAKLAKLAAEAVAAITDLPLADKSFAPSPAVEAGQGEQPPPQADPPGDPTPDPVDEIPQLDAAKVRAWWAERRRSYEDGRRYLRGKPLSPASAATIFTEGSLRRLEPSAFEIAVRAGAPPRAPALRLAYPTPQIAPSLALARSPMWR